MDKPNLIILTSSFPGIPSTQEIWLLEELKQTHQNYNEIIIVPAVSSTEYIKLPANCKILQIDRSKFAPLSLKEILDVVKITASGFGDLLAKGVFYKEFRYNLALIKNLYTIAKYILSETSSLKGRSIVYAYWADNLATCASIMRSLKQDLTFITRAHSYEIYEEQSKHGFIPFRNFQLSRVNKIYTDSYKGYLYLKDKHPNYTRQLECSYVGVNDHGDNPFLEKNALNIVSCSFVREQKRLYLMPQILQHITTPVTWHLIGEGPDLEALKKLCEKLPSNITIKYIGYLSNEAIINYYRTISLDLFVSVSSIEGLPVSLIEAISFGMPILSTDVGGCNEICNSQTGILIPKDFDPVSVAKQIADFKNSAMNTLEFRKGVKQFWSENFSSSKNYSEFSKKIINLK